MRYLFPQNSLEIVKDILNRNLTGVARQIIVELQDDGELGFSTLFRPENLADCVYWHLADAAAGGWVRRCADPRCGAFFLARNRRVKYCPPPMGILGDGVSPCMNRAKVRRHYHEQKKTNKKSTDRRRTNGGN